MKKHAITHYLALVVMSVLFSGCIGIFSGLENPFNIETVTPPTLSATENGLVKVIHPNGHESTIKTTDTFCKLDSNGATYKLLNNIFLTASLQVPSSFTVTLDLNGFVLTGADTGSVISNSGNLTIIDSRPDAVHKYTKSEYGFYIQDDTNGDITVLGGAITGGISVGGIHNATDSSMVMKGGNIVGNYADDNGGGVINYGTFTMNGGNIVGNMAKGVGSAVYNDSIFTMENGNIFENTAETNGVYNDLRSTFTMSGGGITDCIFTNSDAIAIKGGYFGDDAKNSISESWLIAMDWIDNNNSDSKHPKHLFPHKLNYSPYLSITTSGNKPSYIDNLATFNTMDSDGATYKLLRNVQLVSELTVPETKTVTLDLNGFILKSAEGSIAVTNKGDFTLMDGVPSMVHKYTKGDDGLYIWDDTNGTIELAGGAIVGSNNSGGVKNSGTFTMKGGNIAGNNAITDSSDGGGGVCNVATFIMEGGNIVGNKSTTSGGGIYNGVKSTFIIRNGSVTDNTAPNGNGGGVYNNGTFTLEGGSIANNRITNANGAGVYNVGIFIMNYGGIKDTIYKHSGTITINGGYFGSDAKNSIQSSWLPPGFAWPNNDGGNESYPSDIFPYAMKVYYLSITPTTGGTSHITDLATFNTLSSNGATYKLLRNVELLSDLTVPANTEVTLDLNGFILTGTGKDSVVTNNGNLIITDSTPTKTHKYTKGDDGLYTLNDSSGDITLNGGAIIGGNSSGGGVDNTNNGIFTMNAGNIVGNKSSDGGGVRNNGTFTMNDGSITGNTSSNSGGGVNNESGTFTMNDGSITGNTSSNSGGGVNNESGTFTMEGGTIRSNETANGDAGVNNKSIFIMKDGGIDGKIVGGGTIYGGYFGDNAKDSILESWFGDKLVWNTNSGNNAQYPDDVFPHKLENAPYVLKMSPNNDIDYINDLKTFDALNTDGATYKLLRNVQLKNGPLTVPANATVTLDLNGFVLKGAADSSVITNNKNITIIDNNPSTVHKYTKNSDGLYTWDDTNGTIELAGGAITGGSDTLGGGVVNWGTFTMNGGSIVGNTAASNGGGVYNGIGTFTMNGGSIVGNTAASFGGGVYNRTSGTFTMEGGSIVANTANRGGGVCNDSTFTMEGGGIKDEIHRSSGTILIKGGYFGDEAKASIEKSWLSEDLIWAYNSGNDPQYPKDIFPNTPAITYILKTPFGGDPSYITDLTEFNALEGNGVTYKLLKSVQLINNLEIPDNAKVTLDLNGFVLKGTGTTSVITNNGNLTLIDSKPDGVHKYTKGNDGLYAWDDTNGTIELAGGAITGGASNDGGGVFNKDTFTMESGNIVGNTASYGGGGVYNKGTFTMDGGSIVANTATEQGGGVRNYSTFTMNGGSIVGNTATEQGGGVYNSATITMDGGSIVGNKADSGDGVCNYGNDGTFTMNGGGIKDEIQLSGGTISIKGGYFGTAAYDSIDESWIAEGFILGKNNGSDALYPAADFPHKVSVAYISVTKNGSHVRSIDEGELKTFSALNTDGATYTLLQNIELINDLIVPNTATVTLDLNGYVLKGTGTKSVITNNRNLTLIDSKSDAVHKYTKGDDGLYTWDDTNGTIEVTGGAITGGSATFGGGVHTKGIFTMDGGSIVGNKASTGGGVLNGENCTFTMTGGIITGNTAELYGGGVGNSNGDFTMEGGTIIGNTAKYAGGVSSADEKSSFTMNGGSISDNTAKEGGGGVTNSYIFTMNGGSISGNTAKEHGGGVHNFGTFIMNKGSITDNTTGDSDGVYNETSFTMNGGGIKDTIYRADGTISIKGDYFGEDAKNSIDPSWVAEGFEWDDNDGADAMYPAADFPHKLDMVYVLVTEPDGSTMSIGREELKTFSALSTSGATYKLLRNVELVSAPLTVPGTATVTLDLNGFVLKGTGSASVITNNGNLTLIDSNPTAVHKYTKDSDGLYTWDDEAGTIELAGGAITGGSVGKGGGVYNTDTGTFTMEGGSIVGNRASNGGGVYNYTDSTFTMNGGSIVGNKASSYGGGVYNDVGTFTMNGGGIKDDIYRYNSTISINGGYFGEDAKNSIDPSWVAEGFEWSDNDGSDAMYPAADYPHKLRFSPYVEVTVQNSPTSYITDLTKFKELTTGGATYKLKRNIELTSDLTVPAATTATLDLNGFVLKGTGTTSVITNYGNLTLIDSQPNTMHKYTKNNDGLYTWDDTNGTIELAGGVITGGAESNNVAGGGVENQGTITMNGGNIVGNTSLFGGGVKNVGATSLDSFTINGGNIIGNTATISANGLYNQSTFIMNGGGIKDIILHHQGTIKINGGYFGDDAKNTIDNSWLADGLFFMENTDNTVLYPSNILPYKLHQNTYIQVTHSDNTTSLINNLSDFRELSKKGATYKLLQNVELLNMLTVIETATVTLDLNGYVLRGTGSDSVIENNGNLTLIDSNPTAVHKYTKGDDGLYTLDDTNGTIELAGGAITGGSVGFGGGVNNTSTFTMESGNIVGNTASYGGGGVYNAGGTFTMNGGSITGNTAAYNGGGVYTYRNGTFTMNGGSIEGNTTSQDGGGVYNGGGTFTMNNGSITGNTAAYDGGGVYNDDTFTMSGGGIKDTIYRQNGTISINGGSFGEDAQKSIDKSWLSSGRSWANNDGSNSAYPKDMYPYMVK